MIKISSPILIAIVAIFCGSVMDATAKAVALFLPVATLLWWRFLIAAVVVTIPYVAAKKSFGGRSAVQFHAFRGGVQAFTVFLFFTGISLIPLAEATVLGFTAVLMVPFLERLGLGEPLRPIAIAAAILGFAGVVILNGGFQVADVPADQIKGRIYCLVAALLYAVMLLLLRARAAKDGPHLMAVYSNIMPGLWLTIPMVMQGVVPTFDQFPALAWLAFTGSVTWILMTMAYAKAPAQVLAPLEYTSLLWAALFGFLFFDEVPPNSLWLGALFIMAAVGLVAFKDRLRARPASASRAPVVPDDDI